MRPVKWGRVLTAMVTPFRSNLEVDLEATRVLARTLIARGSDGLVVGGTTGESPSLTHDEKLRLLRTVIDEVGGRASVIAGTGTNQHSESLTLTREAEKAGADGVMLVTPYYNKPPQEGLVAHFTRVAESTSLPVLLYNVPSRTGVNLLPASVERLSRVPNIVALKDASGNLEQTTETLRLVPDDFLIYSGEDSLTLPIVSVGGYGVVSVAAHIAGREIKQMIDLAVSGHHKQASKAHQRLYPVFKAMFVTTNPIPVKAALRLQGLDVGSPRLPLVPANESEEAMLKKTMFEAGLL